MPNDIQKYTEENRALISRNDISAVVGALTKVIESRDILPEIKAQIAAIKITDQLSYSEMGLAVQRARSVGKVGESELRPYLDKVNEVRNTLLEAIRNHEREAHAVAEFGASQQAEWNRQERIRAEREQRERDELNRKKAADDAAKLKAELEEKAAREKDAKVKQIREMLRRKEITKAGAAKLLKEAGAMEEAALAQASADAEVVAANPKKETVQPMKTTVAGQRARAPIVYTITNIEKIPRHLLYPNPDQKTGEWKVADFPRLNEMVRKAATPEAAEAAAGGGIEAWRDDRV